MLVLIFLIAIIMKMMEEKKILAAEITSPFIDLLSRWNRLSKVAGDIKCSRSSKSFSP